MRLQHFRVSPHLAARLLGIICGTLILGPAVQAQYGNLTKTENATQRAPWNITFSGPQGLTLTYDGVPIIRQSSLSVVKPGWTGALFDGRNQKYQEERTATSVTTTGENELFRAEYRFQSIDERNFRLTFQGTLKQDVPAMIEYAAGYFNANLFTNRAYNAQTPEGVRSGTVPNFPTGKDHYENDLVPNFQTLELDSRIGKLKIRARSSSRVMFFDARRNPMQWARAAPIFWCGWLGGEQPLRTGEPVKLELDITVEPQPELPHKQLTLRPQLKLESAVYSSSDRPLQVIPQPRMLKSGSGTAFRLSSATPIPWQCHREKQGSHAL